MPAWIHDRAEHILAKNPSMRKSTAFAIATQQSHRMGKSPKGYGTKAGKREAKAKYDKPKKEYVKTPNPGDLETPKLSREKEAAQKDEPTVGQRMKKLISSMYGGAKEVGEEVVESVGETASQAGKTLKKVPGQIKAELQELAARRTPGRYLSKKGIEVAPGEVKKLVPTEVKSFLKVKQSQHAFLEELASINENPEFHSKVAAELEDKGIDAFPKEANGDMLQYFRDHPEKLKAKQEREKKAFRKSQYSTSFEGPRRSRLVSDIPASRIPPLAVKQAQELRQTLLSPTSVLGGLSGAMSADPGSRFGGAAAGTASALGAMKLLQMAARKGKIPADIGSAIALVTPFLAGMTGGRVYSGVKRRITSPKAEKTAAIGVGAPTTKSQYSGPLSYGRFKMVSGIPGWQEAPIARKYQGPGRSHLMAGQAIVKRGAAMATATESMSPKARLSHTQRMGAPKTTGFSGPSIADISKPRGFGMKLPGAMKNKIGHIDKQALLERLVRLGATDIPKTPRLLMKKRSPKELADLQRRFETAYAKKITDPITRVAEPLTKRVPKKIQPAVRKGLSWFAEDPVGTVLTNLSPIPGTHPSYMVGKKGLEKLIDRVAPVAA